MANLLGYGEPQILEVFKNTLPTKLYWILFPIEDLRQAVDTAKRILTKEKLDKQLTGQTFTSPFMSIREGTDKRVLFDTRDELGDKIDKLTVVMSKLVATMKEGPLSHKYIKVEDRIGCMVREVISPDHMIETGAKIQKEIQDKIIEVIDLGEILVQIIDRTVEKGTGMRGMVVMTIEIGTSQEREHL